MKSLSCTEGVANEGEENQEECPGSEAGKGFHHERVIPCGKCCGEVEGGEGESHWYL